MTSVPIVQKYDPDEASYARSASGATGTWAVKAGHAMMLKGGVIMGALARSLILAVAARAHVLRSCSCAREPPRPHPRLPSISSSSRPSPPPDFFLLNFARRRD
jgi:hypothetical protein